MYNDCICTHVYICIYMHANFFHKFQLLILDDRQTFFSVIYILYTLLFIFIYIYIDIFVWTHLLRIQINVHI
jgi:hypothetical protein